MKKSFKILSAIALSLSAVTATAAVTASIVQNKVYAATNSVNNVYVSATGTSAGDGTAANPYDFVTAISNAKAGDNILLAGGIYEYDTRLQIFNSGTPDKYITLKPVSANDSVIFDFSAMKFDGSNRGIQTYADYWHIQDITVRGAGDNGMYIAGNNNIIENCVFYNNKDTGLQLGRGFSHETTMNQWPSYNLIKNCVSYANYDAETYGENADGYAAKLTVGYGNVFDGCIAFRNSDDGWDLFAKVDSGDIGTVTLYNCVSFENGYLPYKVLNADGSGDTTYDTLNGDGIGFKLGGSTMKGNVIVNNCAAWNNKLHGIGDNSNPGVIQVSNFTSFNNCAGFNYEDGTVKATRGLLNVQNKSNNIDLARSTASYNSYYGVLSYINNQSNGYTNENDSSYNKDSFRGSTAYSVFQTGYNKGEIYTSYTGWSDASSYATDTVDTAFAYGSQDVSVTDSDFKSLSSINATCDTVNDLPELATMIENYRNDDHSVNLGDLLALSDDSKFKTFADGNPIGAVLNKSSYSDYDHYSLIDLTENTKTLNANEAVVQSAASIVEPITRLDATYQDFRIPKLIQGADITWASSNTDIIAINKEEETTTSGSVFSWAKVYVPATTTTVTLTATISCGTASTTKTFDITVRGRNQSLGELYSSGDSAIRVNLYGIYSAPRVYAVDASAITNRELPAGTYDLEYTYRYAKDGNSKFYPIDGVYTSVAGVYEVTATATWVKDREMVEQLTYKVYVVDPDCEVDFIDGESTVVLSKDGYVVSGALSNIDGYVVGTYSTEDNAFTTPEAVIKDANAQRVEISTDSISAEFAADNLTIGTSDTQYYAYYTVINKNESNLSTAHVYKTQITVETVNTKDDFYKLARTGSLVKDSATTIYSLTADLDFADYNWKLTNSESAFSGLFRGNGHLISNITVTGNSKTDQKSVNVFYKVSGGAVIDTYFDSITLSGDRNLAKQIGIIGELQGGYVSGIHATKVKAEGKESVGAIVGQVSGLSNYISNCSLVNPITDWSSYVTAPASATETTFGFDFEGYKAVNNYVISANNKYAGGIVGNAQKNSEVDYLNISITECYTNAVIGDGYDAGGNTGLIIGRIKNETIYYNTYIAQNVAHGLVISKGQYGSGIVGDFDNGVGYVNIQYNFSDVTFVYNGTYLNAKNSLANNLEVQQYAHKNMNPIVGRAVKATDGIYETKGNVGSWVEYYSKLIKSSSLAFGLSYYSESHEWYVITSIYARVFLGYKTADAYNAIWTFDEETQQYTMVNSTKYLAA